MRRVFATIVLSIALTAAFAGIPATSANAAVNQVTVNTILDATVETGSKVTIKPSVARVGRTKIKSLLIAVKSGHKTIVSKKKSASLPAGRYKVTTTVKYTLGSSRRVHTRKLTQMLTLTPVPPFEVPLDSDAPCAFTLNSTVAKALPYWYKARVNRGYSAFSRDCALDQLLQEAADAYATGGTTAVDAKLATIGDVFPGVTLAQARSGRMISSLGYRFLAAPEHDDVPVADHIAVGYSIRDGMEIFTYAYVRLA